MRLDPAGLREKTLTRHKQSPDTLVALCRKFLDYDFDSERKYNTVDIYNHYVGMLANITVTNEEANALAIHPNLRKHQERDRIGLFISLLHNYCVNDNVIIYDLNVRIVDIGFASKKLFVNRGSSLLNAFEHSTGITINLGNIGTLGAHQNGLLVCRGEIERYNIEGRRSSFLLIDENQKIMTIENSSFDRQSLGGQENRGFDCQPYSAQKNRGLNYQSYNPQVTKDFLEYTSALAATCGKGKEAIAAAYGKDPVVCIAAQVKSILSFDPWEKS